MLRMTRSPILSIRIQTNCSPHLRQDLLMSPPADLREMHFLYYLLSFIISKHYPLFSKFIEVLSFDRHQRYQFIRFNYCQLLQGSSGSPLMLSQGSAFYEVGFHSHGAVFNRLPCVYTRVDAYMDFIASALK